MLQRRRRPDLDNEPLGADHRGEFRLQHFHRHASLMPDVVREVHRRHAAFTDALVHDAKLVALRRKVKAKADPNCAEDAVSIRITLGDGRTVEKHVSSLIAKTGQPNRIALSKFVAVTTDL